MTIMTLVIMVIITTFGAVSTGCQDRRSLDARRGLCARPRGVVGRRATIRGEAAPILS